MKTDILNLIPKKYLLDASTGGAMVRRVPASFVEIPEPEASKIWCGFNHVVTTRLLCPAKYIKQFERDPEGYMRCPAYCICISDHQMQKLARPQEQESLVD
jgi:hypothetical protein